MKEFFNIFQNFRSGSSNQNVKNQFPKADLDNGEDVDNEQEVNKYFIYNNYRMRNKKNLIMDQTSKIT